MSKGFPRTGLPRQPRTPTSDPNIRLLLDNLYYHGALEADPSSPREGEMWLRGDTSTLELRAFLGGAPRVLATSSEVGATIPWEQVTGKPDTFPSSAHRHPWSDLDNVPTFETPGGAQDKVDAAILAHAQTVDPHPQYLTASEGAAAFEPVGSAAAAVAAHAAAGDPHPQYLTSAEGNAAYEAAGAVAAHVAAGDPHPQYLTAAEGNAAYETKGLMAAHVAAGDPHAQYLNNARGDARYSLLAHTHLPAAITTAGPYTRPVFASSTPGAYLGVTSGTTGAIRMVSGGGMGWFIYVSDGDGTLYFSDDAENILLALGTDGAFSGIQSMTVDSIVTAPILAATSKVTFPGGHSIEKERGGSQTDWEYWHGTNGSTRPNMKMAAGVAALFNAPALNSNVMQLWQPHASSFPMFMIAHETSGGTGDYIQVGRYLSNVLNTVWRVRADGSMLGVVDSAGVSGIIAADEWVMNAVPVAASSAQFIGGRYTVNAKSPNAAGSLNAAVIAFVGESILDAAALAGVPGSFIGANGAATQNHATQTVANSYGVFGTARSFGAGPVTNAYSLYGRTRNDSTGTVANAYGASVVVQVNSTGAITTGYGYHVQSAVKAAGGTLGTFYGLYIAAQTAATTNWGIYQAGSMPSRVGGRFAIGADGSWGNSTGPALFLASITTEPTANPAGGAIHWVTGNSAKFRFPNGDVVTLLKGAAIAAPAGGATVDAEARTAISSILTRLTNAGLI